MAKGITVYTSNNCAYCGMVKKYLAMKGQEFEEVNIEQNPEKQQEMIEMTGVMTVPVTIIVKDDETKDVTIGFNAAKLASALAQVTLQRDL